MADFSTLLSHPDVEEIVSKLISGSSSKEVCQWLKLKYPDKNQKHLCLAQKLLTDFSKSPYLTDYYGQFKKDLANVSNGMDLNNPGLAKSILNNKTYSERLNEIADKELDWIKMLENLIAVCYQRVEQVFDTMQQNPMGFKADNYLLRYLAEITSAAERLEKMKILAPDSLMQHNVTMQAVDEQTAYMQDVIREVLSEIDPETAMLFMEKMTAKLSKLKSPQPVTQDKIIKEVQILEAKILD